MKKTPVHVKNVLALPVSPTRGQHRPGSCDSWRVVRTITMRAIIQRVTKASVTGKQLF